jgi:hypothetical protein
VHGWETTSDTHGLHLLVVNRIRLSKRVAAVATLRAVAGWHVPGYPPESTRSFPCSRFLATHIKNAPVWGGAPPKQPLSLARGAPASLHSRPELPEHAHLCHQIYYFDLIYPLKAPSEKAPSVSTARTVLLLFSAAHTQT